MMNNIRLIEVFSEVGAGTRGASMGIDALKIACLNKQSDFFSKYESICVEDRNNMLYKNNAHPHAKHIDVIHDNLADVCKAVYQTFQQGAFPLVLAADHSSAAGTIAGIKQQYPHKRLGVIWIDAHADLHSPYTTPSGNMHGMPLAIALNHDNLESQINEPSPATIALWDKVKSIGGKGAKLATTDLVFIGVRDTEAPENYLMNTYNIRNVTIDEVDKLGVKYAAEQALTHLQACDIIYVSYDVDSLDSNYSIGTGTPVPEGLTPSEVVELNMLLVNHPKVVCWEIVEINPTLDHKNKMAEIAFNVLEKVGETIAHRTIATTQS